MMNWPALLVVSSVHPISHSSPPLPPCFFPNPFIVTPALSSSHTASTLILKERYKYCLATFFCSSYCSCPHRLGDPTLRTHICTAASETRAFPPILLAARTQSPCSTPSSSLQSLQSARRHYQHLIHPFRLAATSLKDRILTLHAMTSSMVCAKLSQSYSLEAQWNQATSAI